jgi:hypothetical protein
MRTLINRLHCLVAGHADVGHRHYEGLTCTRCHRHQKGHFPRYEHEFWQSSVSNIGLAWFLVIGTVIGTTAVLVFLIADVVSRRGPLLSYLP